MSLSGLDRRGTDQQLMMKYDPVICGLSAAEDVREREREGERDHRLVVGSCNGWGG